jgi:hypothetical protein
MPQDNWRFDGLEFSSPTSANTLSSLAIGSSGVYVGECGSTLGSAATKVLRFSESGTFISRFAATFAEIVGLACDSAGNVYVLDRGDSRVKLFDQAGSFIRQWGEAGSGDGQFNLSAVNGSSMIAVARNDEIFVCDPQNSRVQVFDSNGTFLRKWGQPGSLPGQFYYYPDPSYQSGNEPYQFAASSNGTVYVTGGAGIKVFDAFGTFQTLFTSSVAIPTHGTPGLGRYAAAVAPDGLVAVYVQQTSFNGLGIVDPARSYESVHGFPAALRYAGSVAFSKRGDVFVIDRTAPASGKKVVVYEREYSNVQNSLLPPAIPHPLVLAAAQRPGTSWMDIDYQVTDADSTTVTMGVLAFKNGGNTLTDSVVMNTFEEGTGGNVGANQPTGVTRHLTWNMAADWTIDFAQVQVEALARDSRNLLGFHWITIPASGGDPAIQVSAGPVADDKLLDVWFWLLATHQPGISLSNGTITGTVAPYNGQSLASGASTTAAGRSYLYGLMNVRAITAAEITRAQGGNYGFSSVTANSVVRLP